MVLIWINAYFHQLVNNYLYLFFTNCCWENSLLFPFNLNMKKNLYCVRYSRSVQSKALWWWFSHRKKKQSHGFCLDMFFFDLCCLLKQTLAESNSILYPFPYPYPSAYPFPLSLETVLGHHYYTDTREHTSSSSYNTHIGLLVCIRA